MKARIYVEVELEINDFGRDEQGHIEIIPSECEMILDGVTIPAAIACGVIEEICDSRDAEIVAAIKAAVESNKMEEAA